MRPRGAPGGSRPARELNYYHDEDGCLVIRARLPAEDGAVVLQALNAAMDALQTEDTSAEDVTAVTSQDENRFAQRRADALTTMAETTLRHSPEPLSSAERYQVVVHVTAVTLAADADGRCELESGQGLAPDTSRRIACDSSLLRITEDDAGNPLDIGHKTRAVSPALRRALQSRDGGCRFPGCTHSRFVDAHHIRHWADGGETSIDNLALLCRHHHRLVHEGGFGLERNNDGHLCFSRPDGRVIEHHPQLSAVSSEEGLHGPGSHCGHHFVGGTIGAKDWIIPGGVLDYDIAIAGLMPKLN